MAKSELLTDQIKLAEYNSFLEEVNARCDLQRAEYSKGFPCKNNTTSTLLAKEIVKCWRGLNVSIQISFEENNTIFIEPKNNFAPLKPSYCDTDYISNNVIDCGIKDIKNHLVKIKNEEIWPSRKEVQAFIMAFNINDDALIKVKKLEDEINSYKKDMPYPMMYPAMYRMPW